MSAGSSAASRRAVSVCAPTLSQSWSLAGGGRYSWEGPQVLADGDVDIRLTFLL